MGFVSLYNLLFTFVHMHVLQNCFSIIYFVCCNVEINVKLNWIELKWNWWWGTFMGLLMKDLVFTLGIDWPSFLHNSEMDNSIVTDIIMLFITMDSEAYFLAGSLCFECIIYSCTLCKSLWGRLFSVWWYQKPFSMVPTAILGFIWLANRQSGVVEWFKPAV